MTGDKGCIPGKTVLHDHYQCREEKGGQFQQAAGEEKTKREDTEPVAFFEIIIHAPQTIKARDISTGQIQGPAQTQGIRKRMSHSDQETGQLIKTFSHT